MASPRPFDHGVKDCGGSRGLRYGHGFEVRGLPLNVESQVGLYVIFWSLLTRGNCELPQYPIYLEKCLPRVLAPVHCASTREYG